MAKLEKGINDLATVNPELAKQWHPTKNINLKDGYGKDISAPDKVGANSKHKAWWLCEFGHEWKATIQNRNNGSKCPYCSGKKAIENETDLATKNPAIANLWHPTKNGNLKPSYVKPQSRKIIFLKCNDCNQEWSDTLRNIGDNKGCPYCLGVRVIDGVTDLKTTYPDIAAQWHPFLNGILKPNQFLSGSDKKVWWQCEYGHEWKAVIRSRTLMESGCPVCNKERTSSFPEQAIYYYIKQYFPDALNNDKLVLSGKELDIYIPSLKIGIEYDGEFYHQNTERDTLKNKIAFENRIKLIRIREKGCPVLNDNLAEYILRKNKSNKDLTKIIKLLLKTIGVKTFDVDVERDFANIFKQINICKKEKSLQVTHPELSTEWHPVKNGKLKPDMVTAGSNKKVWWKCKYGHEWKTTVLSRSRGTGCPTCHKDKRNKTTSTILDNEELEF